MQVFHMFNKIKRIASSINKENHGNEWCLYFKTTR
jgi:hypothetical protein